MDRPPFTAQRNIRCCTRQHETLASPTRNPNRSTTVTRTGTSSSQWKNCGCTKIKTQITDAILPVYGHRSSNSVIRATRSSFVALPPASKLSQVQVLEPLRLTVLCAPGGRFRAHDMAGRGFQKLG